MRDRRGLAVHGSVEAVAAHERALDHLLRFRAELVDAGADAVAADPGFALGHVMNCYVSLMSTDGAATAAARKTFEAATIDAPSLAPRERAHVDAARRWMGGDMIGAGGALDALAIEHPRDLLALAVGHQIDFFTGDARNLRDRIGRAIDAWGPDDPEYGFLLGMQAFGLEECNLYESSEEIGRRAVDTNADDVWALHAVVHTYEMQGRIADGVRYMRDRERYWATDNFLNVHNSWHYALYALQGNDVEGALAIYDRALYNDRTEDVALELLDATSLLWRLQLDGLPVGDRWALLAAAWGRCLAPGLYPFNDMHATMAYVGAGELGAAVELVRELEQVGADPDPWDTGATMTASVGLPVCRAILAYGDGDHRQVVAELMGVRPRLHTFGGSHAQRDAVERTLVRSASLSGDRELARALLSERLGVRDASTWSWAAKARACAVAGDVTGAEAARTRSDELARPIASALRSPARQDP